MRSVYENVELIRKHNGITKRELAAKAGISEMTCVRLLCGQSKMCVEILPIFARILKITDIGIFFDDALTDSVINSN